MAASSVPASSSGVDYSINAQSLAGLTLVQTIPIDQRRLGYFVQNQDINKVYVVFDRDASDTGSVAILAAASALGEPGGYIDMQAMPHSGRMRVYCSAATPRIAARAW